MQVSNLIEFTHDSIYALLSLRLDLLLGVTCVIVRASFFVVCLQSNVDYSSSRRFFFVIIVSLICDLIRTKTVRESVIQRTNRRFVGSTLLKHRSIDYYKAPNKTKTNAKKNLNRLYCLRCFTVPNKIESQWKLQNSRLIYMIRNHIVRFLFISIGIIVKCCWVFFCRVQ